ncbi:MAG: hypothetical protein RRZ65_02190 [Tannerellaceae bacterium]
MKRLLSSCMFASTLLLAGCNGAKEEPMGEVIERGLSASTEQAMRMAVTATLY